tara:strand:- start:482 stop:1297 length:816 start_codon:yes stop_codon:yes gene_type:complete
MQVFSNNDLFQKITEYAQARFGDIRNEAIFIYVNGSERTIALDYAGNNTFRAWEVRGANSWSITAELHPNSSPMSQAQLQTLVKKCNTQSSVCFKLIHLNEKGKGPFKEICRELWMNAIQARDAATMEWQLREMMTTPTAMSDEMTMTVGVMVVKTIVMFAQDVYQVEVSLSTDNNTLNVCSTVNGAHADFNRVNFVVDEPTLEDLQNNRKTDRCIELSQLLTQLAHHVLNERTYFKSSIPRSEVFRIYNTPAVVISEWKTALRQLTGCGW